MDNIMESENKSISSSTTCRAREEENNKNHQPRQQRRRFIELFDNLLRSHVIFTSSRLFDISSSILESENTTQILLNFKYIANIYSRKRNNT